MAETVGVLLWEMRTARGVSLGRLAAQTGVSKAALSRWESGQRQPRVPELEAALYALGASAAQRARVFARMDAPRALRRLCQTVVADTGLGAPPTAGSLLRALRLRQHTTQEEAAQRVGVDRSSLARWERGERLPSTEQVQALCFALGAREEELVALTTGRFREGPAGPEPATWDEAEADLRGRLEALNALPMDDPGPQSGVKDLPYLLLERETWEWALREEAARPLLARVYACDANYRVTGERWDEGGAQAEQALGAFPEPRQDTDVVLRAVIARAAALAHGGYRPAPERGARLLETWLPRGRALPDYRAWMLADMGKYAVQAGRVESGLALAEQACRIASEQCAHPVESFLRRCDHARLLLQSARPADALRVVPEPEGEDYPRWSQATATLLSAEAQWRAGSRDEARDWLQRALRLIDTHHLDRVRPQASALAQQF